MKPEISKRSCGRLCAAALASLGLVLSSGQTPALAAHSMPRIVSTNGHHALLVDGEPFLMLGAQCYNSSAWPATLPKVWAAIEDLHANTLEIPIYWEQFEPEPGKFDPSIVDLIIKGAREHNVRLVFLWFGTWKNGSGHYIPLWAKRRPEMFTHITGNRGQSVDSPSPLAEACLKADMKAFSALMRHLKSVDPVHTVIMIQVENEPGAWGSIRDYSPEAEKVFAAPVPTEFLKALGGRNGAKTAGGTWREVFGDNADEYFHAYCVAHYIDQVAAAGKADYRPTDPSILRQNTVDRKARLVTSFEPDSNEFAQANGIVGMALYHIVVGPDGKTREIAVGRPIGFGLDENAVATIRKASFQPAVKDGQPVAVLLDLVVQFRIFSQRTAPISQPEPAEGPAEAMLPGPYSVPHP